jgi:hypothetical protein
MSSLSISGVGAILPIAPTPPVETLYAHNETVTASSVATTLGAEAGAAAVVYQPSASDESETFTYSSRQPTLPSKDDSANAKPDQLPDQLDAYFAESAARLAGTTGTGDQAVVSLTGSIDTPPAAAVLPEAPLSKPVNEVVHTAWAPVGPAIADPATVGANPQAPAQFGQFEAAAQATYAAVANASVSGASLSDLHKFA